jgi:hypothetical protein
VLAENGRLGDTHNIVDKFEELMMASRGEVKAVVTSAEARARRNPSLALCLPRCLPLRARTLPRRARRCRSPPRRRDAGGALHARTPARLAPASAREAAPTPGFLACHISVSCCNTHTARQCAC